MVLVEKIKENIVLEVVNLLKIKFKLLALCSLILVLSGCFPEERVISSIDTKKIYTEVSNYNFMGEEAVLRFTDIPKRVLVTRPEILDVLAALDVGDRVVMASFPRNMVGQMPDYKKLFPKTELTINDLDKETAVMQRPDFIIGWRRSFRKGGLGSTEYWRDKGVPVYIEENSGPIPAMDPFPPGTVKSEIDFIYNMGKIFGKEKEAAVEIEKIKNALYQAKEMASYKEPKRVLSIAFMKDYIEVFGDKLLLGNIINILGSKNINYPYPFINGEQFLKTDPDVIFVIYTGGTREAEMAMKRLLKEPYAKMRAVKNNKIHLINYKYICAANVRTPVTIKTVYHGLYE